MASWLNMEKITAWPVSVIERFTVALRTIPTDHAYIHDNLGYKTHLELGTVTTAQIFSLKTPVDKYLHFKNLKLSAIKGGAKVSIIRGASVTESGSAVTVMTGPHNMNDNAAVTTGVAVRTITTYADGEVWDFVQVLNDATNQFIPSSETKAFPEEELVMKPDSYYVLQAEKVGGDDPELVTVTMFWYEEDEG